MRHLMLCALMLVAAACAPIAPSPTVTPAPIPSMVETLPPTEESLLGQAANGLFSVTVSGASDSTFAGAVSYSCTATATTLSVTNATNALTLTLPARPALGELTVGEMGATLTVNGVTYAQDVFGLITLDAVPAAANQPLSGSFDLNFSDGNNAVNAIGTFDLLAVTVCR
ncbi:MAG: hypothetical protein ACOYL5_19025 [Phototrophicaceae bacterium]